jgi:hypothetical protein
MSRHLTSATRTLLPAVLLCAGLVLLPSPAKASTITCGFGGSQNSGPGCIGGTNTGFFTFGPYQLTLGFDTVHGPFDVNVTDALTSQSALIQNQRLTGFPGYTCVPLDGTNCVDFQISAPAPGPNTWTGFYNVSIFWGFNTNPNFPNDPGNRIRILHNRGDIPGDGFNSDITVIGSYTGEFRNIGDDDPGIGGRDDNFQSFLVAQAPAAVPEPGTLVLIGSGVASA